MFRRRPVTLGPFISPAPTPWPSCPSTTRSPPATTDRTHSQGLCSTAHITRRSRSTTPRRPSSKGRSSSALTVQGLANQQPERLAAVAFCPVPLRVRPAAAPSCPVPLRDPERVCRSDPNPAQARAFPPLPGSPPAPLGRFRRPCLRLVSAGGHQ